MNDNYMLQSNKYINTSLLCLNEDCLRKIYSYLSFQDQTNFLFVCKRLAEIFLIEYGIKNVLDLKDFKGFFKSKVRDILSVIGPYKTHIRLKFYEFTSSKELFIDLLVKYCPNVEYIEFKYLKNFRCEHVWALHDIFKELKALTIYRSNFTADMCLYLSNIIELRKLNLSNNNGVTGKHLSKFEHLHTLDISYTNFTSENLIRLCQNTPSIKNLSINNCVQLNYKAIKFLQKYSDCLEILSVDRTQLPHINFTIFNKLKSLTIKYQYPERYILCDEFFDELVCIDLENLCICGAAITREVTYHIAQLKTLKTLKIRFCSGIDEYFFICLLDHKLQLTQLECSTMNINVEAVQHYILNCKSIKKIILNACRTVDNKFIYNLLLALSELKYEKPLILNLYGTAVDSSIIKTNIIKESSKLLRLTFDINY